MYYSTYYVLINPPVAIGVWARSCWWLETFGGHFMSSSTRNWLKMHILDFLCTWVLISHRFPPFYDVLFFSTNFRNFSVRRSFSTETETGAYNHTTSTAFGKLGPLETRKYAGLIQNLILYRLVPITFSQNFFEKSIFYKICKSKGTPLQPLKIFIEISNKISSKFASRFFEILNRIFLTPGSTLVCAEFVALSIPHT